MYKSVQDFLYMTAQGVRNIWTLLGRFALTL
jgi:hypothetical protein